MGPYTVCPLSFWFLFAALLNEKLDDCGIFKCFCSSIFKTCSFLWFFFPTKRNSTSISSLRDGQTYVKCFACGTFKPRARRAHDFLLQSGFFSGSHGGCFQFQRWHFLKQIFWHHSLHRQKPPTGELGLESWCTFSEEKEYFSDMQSLLFLR